MSLVFPVTFHGGRGLCRLLCDNIDSHLVPWPVAPPVATIGAAEAG